MSWTFIEFQPWYAVILGIVVGALGYLYGDRFWHWLGEKIGWFY